MPGEEQQNKSSNAEVAADGIAIGQAMSCGLLRLCECSFHHGRFDLCTRTPTFPPCSEPVRVWTAPIRGGQICIDPAATR